MNVLLVIKHKKEIPLIIPWALTFARAEKAQLKILCVHQGLKKGEPRQIPIKGDDHGTTNSLLLSTIKFLQELNEADVVLVEPDETLEAKEHPLLSVSLYFREHPQVAQAALGFIDHEKAKLVICHHTPGDRKDDLGHQLLVSSPVQTLVLNGNNPPPKKGEASILVSISSGPHVQQALRTSHNLAESLESRCTALYIEADGGEDAEEVGLRQIKKVCQAAKIKLEDIDAEVVLADKPEVGIARALGNKNWDLVLLGASQKGIIRRIFFGNLAETVFRHRKQQAVGIVKSSIPMASRTLRIIDKLLNRYVPQLDREARVSLFESLQSGSNWSLDFIALICLSSGIASLGLIQNSTAIVIGAMLVAPLMTPMIGAGLGLVQGNTRLTSNAARSIIFGFLMALSIGFLSGLLTPIQSPTPEIIARGAPNLLDLFVAVLSGMAAAYAIARPGLSGALPGVAIAAALVPPITSSGIALSLGEAILAQGAASLFGINLLAIILGAAATLYALGARPDQKFSFSRVWVRRTLVGLIMATIIAAIPLAAGLFTYLQEDRPLGQSIEESMPKGPWSLAEYQRQDDDLLIVLEGPTALPQKQFRQLSQTLRQKLEGDLTIRVESKIIFTDR